MMKLALINEQQVKDYYMRLFTTFNGQNLPWNVHFGHLAAGKAESTKFVKKSQHCDDFWSQIKHLPFEYITRLVYSRLYC